MSPSSLGVKPTPRPFTIPRTPTSPTSFNGGAATQVSNNYNSWANSQALNKPNFSNPLSMTGNVNRNLMAPTTDRSQLSVGGSTPGQQLQQQTQGVIGNKTQMGAPNALNLNLPAYGSIGLSNLRSQAGSNGMTGSGAVNTATSNQTSPTSQSSTPTREQQIAALTTQMNGLQSQLDAKRAASTQNSSQTGTTGNSNTLQGILDSLLGQSKVTREQERVRKEMEEVARQNRAIGDEAKRVSDEYGAEIARVGQLGAGAVAGNLSSGTNVVGAGNAAIASQSASSRMAALSQAQAASLKGTEQQLTAQQQTTEGLNPSLQAALTQQQTGVTGLSNAAGYAQPTQVPYSNQFIDPVTGQSAGGAGLGGFAGYNAAVQSIELGGQYPDAGAQYDPNLSPEQNLQRMQQAIQGSATYQRGAFGTAGADSYIGAQQLGAAGGLTQEVAKLQTVGNAADANFMLILDIAKRGQINDLNQPVLNQLVQGINRGLTSNQDVVAFRSGLQTVRSQYAQILGGGTPTDATQAMAAEKIPDTVSLGALQEVERTMKSLINNTVASYNQQIDAYSNQGGGGNSFAEQW